MKIPYYHIDAFASARFCGNPAGVDVHGNVLMNTLVRPTVPILEVVSAIHHITNEAVQDAPTFVEVMPQLRSLLHGGLVISYNADFDWVMIVKSANAHGLAWSDELLCLWKCAMTNCAMFRGAVNPRFGTYRWHKLNEAARFAQCGIPLPLDLHRALADAELARRVVLHIASVEMPTRIE